MLVDQQNEEFKIRAVAKTKSLTIAHQLRLMHSNDVWKVKSHDGSEINPTLLPKSSTFSLDVVFDQSKFQKEYKIRVAKVGDFEATTSYLVSFEEK